MADYPAIYIVLQRRSGRLPMAVKVARQSEGYGESAAAREAHEFADKRNQLAGDSPDRDRYEAVRYVAADVAEGKGCRR